MPLGERTFGSKRGFAAGRALKLLRLGFVLGGLVAGLGALAFADPQALPPMQTVTPIATPTPSPSPSPSPTPSQREVVRGGPLVFSLNGSLAVGNRYQSTTTGTGAGLFTSPSPSASPTPVAGFQNTSSVAQSTQTLGLQAEVTRRTATTVSDLKVPVSFGNTGTQFAQLSALYSTPKYSLGYGPQPVLLFGQLPLGGTLRGFSFIVPSGAGDETLYTGPSNGVNGEGIDLWGFRWRSVQGADFYEAGLVSAWGPLTGRSQTLTFGAASANGFLGTVFEGAWQERSGGDGDPHGLAYQFRLDDGNGADDISTTFRHIPAQFVGFGGGENYGDNYLDANFHTGSAMQTLLFDASYEQTGSVTPGEVTQNRVLSLIDSGSLGRIATYSLNLQQQRLATVNNPSEVQNSNLASFQLGISNSIVAGAVGVQLARILSSIAGETGQVGYQAQFEHNFGRYSFTFGGQIQRLTQNAASPVEQIAESVALGRTFGKTSFQLGTQIARTLSSTSNAVAFTPLASITRRISPALSVQTTLGYSSLRDKLNPSADGHSKIFSIQLTSPFAYGNGPVIGRVDPRLPATISGKVQFEALSAESPVASFAQQGGTNGGLGNVEVILDDRYIQRTDLTGGFQFSFVPAGQHQLRIDTSTLPRGVTVDPPVMTLQLEGGQTALAAFAVGNFGGILGRVYGLDQNGAEIPLPNVMLRLDDGAYSQTDLRGTYGFGRVPPGQHTVAVVPGSVPAYASFQQDKLTQTVVVQNGGYTKLDFGAQPLGSIEGHVFFGPDMKPATGAVPNTYVVAEPGEHAAIDDNDTGEYIIDNLPPGDYTVTVDPETLPEGLGASPAAVTVHLEPGQHVTGQEFTAGRFEKKVVFSFLGGNAGAAVSGIQLADKTLPPGGTTTATIDAPPKAKNVYIVAFGTRQALTYDKSRKEWAADVFVPVDAKAGSYTVSGHAGSGVQPKPAKLAVDPRMPIAIVNYTPANPQKGQYVTVRARFLTDVAPGDRIEWDDGTVTVLGKPVTGRVFTFTKVLSLRPLHGLLLTRRGRLPIELL